MDKILSYFQFLRSSFLNLLGNLNWSELKFGHREDSFWAVFFLILVFAAGLFLRFIKNRKAGRNKIILPAVLPRFRKSSLRWFRYGAYLAFLAGLPTFFIALADPYKPFTREELSYPGRRILIFVDMSGSMGSGDWGESSKLRPRERKRFYTAVAAAQHFVRLRMQGKYRDVIGLIGFGNESYVITPFTNDYENVLTSLRLISDPREFARFKESGTHIVRAINQGVELFRTYRFLHASGNIMIIFSDGEDTAILDGTLTLDQILSEARKNRVPIYFVRTWYDMFFGGASVSIYDDLWSAAVNKTGGKYYAGADEESVLNALEDIDREATGSVWAKRYSVKSPQFQIFAVVTLFFWSVALGLTMLFRAFRKFP